MWRGRFSKSVASPSVTRVLHVGIVACLLAMALLPLIGTGTASAAEDAEPILLEQVDPEIGLVEADKFDLVDPNADPDDEEYVDSDSDSEQEQGDGEGDGDDDYVDPGFPQETGGVYITKHDCEVGFDAANADFESIFAGCPYVPGVGFQIGDSNGGWTGHVTDADGMVLQDGLPAGTTTLTEELPEGYGTPRVFCAVTGQDPLYYEEMWVDYATVSIELGAGQIFACDWFNIPTGGGETADTGDNGIVIYKYSCLEGYDVYNFDADGVASVCGEYQDGVTFNITDGGPTNLSGQSGDDGDGELVFGGLGSGEYFISEEIPAGYGKPIVYCGIAGADEGGPVEPWLMDVSDSGEIFSVLATDDILTCYWFNVPYHGGDNGVVIYKYVCDSGYDVYNFDPDGVASVCGESMDDVTFNVTDGGPINLSGQSGDNGNGKLVFGSIDAGEYFISEEIPAGYGTPIVYCGIVGAGEDEPVEPGQMDVSESGEIFSVLASDDILYCYWFNVPNGDPTDQGMGTDVTVHKNLCPVGYDASGADYETLKNDCGTPQEGVEFTFSNVDLQDQTTEQSGATDADGLVFASIENPGELTISETLGAGYGEPVVFCYNPLLLVGDPGAEDVNGGSVILELSDGETVYCDWFNMPTGDNGIIIYKYVCPYGYDAYHSDADDIDATCTEYQNDVTFTVTDGGPTNASSKTGDAGDGMVSFGALDSGEYFISEETPAGYGTPVVYCGLAGAAEGEPTQYDKMDISGEGEIFSVLATDDYLWCHWFNIPTDDDATVTVDKFECPVGFDAYNATLDELTVNCGGVPMDGVDFTLSYPIDTILPATTGDAGPGKATWTGVGQVPVWITEDVPSGYGEPLVYCFLDDVSWSPDGPYIETEDGVIQIDLTGNTDLKCLWFNVPNDDTVEITIIKHTCPEGYDLNTPGADPEYDCPDLTDGIGFKLSGKPEHPTYQGVTGDNGAGTVTFSGLAWHPWVVTEQVPAGTSYVFILSCEGSSTQQIQGYPLAYGNELGIDVGPGDHVICHWYNVPEVPGGTVTIEKLYCESKNFVSADDCYIYEGGAKFSLSVWNGSSWVEVADGKTDGNGELGWDGLQAGTYQIDEIGAQWCYAVADNTDDNGYLVVNAGEETHVTVYNCGVTTKPRKPGKFPNTGVAPGASMAPGSENAPVSPKTDDEDVLEPAEWMGVFDSRLIEPFLTGVKPVELRIESVGIDAGTETLEIVNGGLQDPTTADKVAWYKDTAKLNEDGNVVMAGHLNYWGVPEGVFFRLDDVKKGDIVEVTGDNGVVYRYKVQWVKQIDVEGADVEKLVGETKKPSLTLITCGGEWDGSIQQYNQRTVLRAVLITE